MNGAGIGAPSGIGAEYGAELARPEAGMSEFPEGFGFVHDGQLYRPIRLVPHLTKDGRTIKLVEWVTECPTCRNEFTTTTLAFTSSRLLRRRRCDACKNPGHTIRREKGPQPIGPAP